MAIPATGQFSMNDIKNEINNNGGPTVGSTDVKLAGGSVPTVGSLFGNATTDVNKTAPHNMSEFRGYSHILSTTFSVQQDSTSGPLACGPTYDGSTYTLYGADAVLKDNSIIYSDAARTTAFAGNNEYYSDQSTWVQLDNSGTVLSSGTCPPPSPTPTVTPTVTPSISITASPSPTPTVTPSTSTAASPTPTPTVTPSTSTAASPTPTPTITVSPTPSPSTVVAYSFNYQRDSSSGPLACGPTYDGSTGTLYGAQSILKNNTVIYSDTGLTLFFAGNSEYFSDQSTWVQIDASGNVLSSGDCPAPSATPSATPTPTPTISVTPSTSIPLQSIRIYPGTDISSACTTTSFVDLYILGGDPNTGEELYTDAGATTIWSNTTFTHFRLSGGNTYYTLDPGTGGNLCRIGSTTGTCVSPTPSTTPSPTPSNTPLLYSHAAANSGESDIDKGDVCSAFTSFNIYTPDSTTASGLSTGNTLYSDPDTVFANRWTGGDLWYGITDSSGQLPSLRFKVDNNGQITTIENC